MKPIEEVRNLLIDGLTNAQKNAVTSNSRQVLVVAGAGSGKTEVMARRVAYWVGVEGVPKNQIVAFTFTEKAAEEMKFRIRRWIERISDEGETVTMGGMYVGTIHGFCLQKLRELWPDEYHNYDIIDETGREALIQREFNRILSLNLLRNALPRTNQGRRQGQFATSKQFQEAYDILHEYNRFEVEMPEEAPPLQLGQDEREWCEQATLITSVGQTQAAQAFAVSAARYYAYIKCRRFLDFSTSQSEFMRRLSEDEEILENFRVTITHLVVDEVQDVNPVQDEIIKTITGEVGKLTAVGDHRQAIYQFRGGRVDIIGRIWEEIATATDGQVVNLEENFRSTGRIIDLANRWAATIGQVGNMATPDMVHGNLQRIDYDPSHVGAKRFPSREEEANWIAETIQSLVSGDSGARHNQRDAPDRGLSRSDIAILLRSSKDARLYMETLEINNIPAIFRAGPDLFSQPEVLLIVSAYSIVAGIDEYYGSGHNSKSLPNRLQDVLNCPPIPEDVLPAACQAVQDAGLPIADDLADRLMTAAQYMCERMNGRTFTDREVARFHCSDLKVWLKNPRQLRRVFHQKLYHMILAEAGIEAWDTAGGRGSTALFHLGALSKMITSIETPGWTSVNDFRYQVIALLFHGTEKGKTEEAPLLVPPDAVTISTIHSAKGLEFPIVFLADVCPSRFPSSRAKREKTFPFEGDILNHIDITQLWDNNNNDSERRLMYVAVTRAERYLFITASGNRQSKFYRSISRLVNNVGGVVIEPNDTYSIQNIQLLPTSFSRDLRLSTSFSDLRYFLECSHDFYLRKVMGFAPTIGQEFGYGKGVHNLLRAVHSDPQRWAELAGQGNVLEQEIQELINRGLFYLRYTTGSPAQNMRQAGLRAVAQYIRFYIDELVNLEFEPEKEFETLLEEEQVLVSGAIDVIRLDDPPRVTLIDFKSGNADNENASGLDEDEMRLQISLYGHAALHELEYQPEQGLVRYLGENDPNRRQRQIDLDQNSINEARQNALDMVRSIKNRKFFNGPSDRKPDRCEICDFKSFCGLSHARNYRLGTNATDTSDVVDISKLSVVQRRQHFYWLGRNYQENGNLEEAINAYKAYSTHLATADKHIPFLWISKMYKQLDDTENGLAYLESYAKGCTPPKAAEIYKEIGEEYLQHQNIEKAVLNFEEAIKNNPSIGVKKQLDELKNRLS